MRINLAECHYQPEYNCLAYIFSDGVAYLNGVPRYDAIAVDTEEGYIEVLCNLPNHGWVRNTYFGEVKVEYERPTDSRRV